MKYEHCIRCTICVENCPVFRVNPDFRVPSRRLLDAQRFRMEREKSVDKWVLLCSQCKRCNMACPCGVSRRKSSCGRSRNTACSIRAHWPICFLPIIII